MAGVAFWGDLIQTEPWPIFRRPFVVAEIGLNHNGDISIAKKLIDVAKEAGCDAVKFQKRTPELCVPPHQREVPRETPWGVMSYMEYRRRIEFGKPEYDEINAYCKSLNMSWFASVWDIPSIQFMRGYNPPYYKIPSALLVHQELLIMTAAEMKMTFLSVGMSDYSEIDRAVRIFKKSGCPFILMHAVSEYPAADNILNLQQLTVLRERYKVIVGYSGHEMTTLPCMVAVTMGAAAIERHITLDRTMWGTDQASSLEPRELREMVKAIKAIPSIVGDGERVVTEREKENAKRLRYYKGLILQ
jgi:N-acetylneuraminate synthase